MLLPKIKEKHRHLDNSKSDIPKTWIPHSSYLQCMVLVLQYSSKIPHNPSTDGRFRSRCDMFARSKSKFLEPPSFSFRKVPKTKWILPSHDEDALVRYHHFDQVSLQILQKNIRFINNGTMCLDSCPLDGRRQIKKGEYWHKLCSSLEFESSKRKSQTDKTDLGNE